MTVDQLLKANALHSTINNYQTTLNTIKTIDTLFCNNSNVNRSIYDETISNMTILIETSNDRKISIKLPKDTSIGCELITDLKNYYQEEKERTQKEFDSFLEVEDVN